MGRGMNLLLTGDEKMDKAIINLYNQMIDISLPAGIVSAYTGDEAPDGWLMCDGKSYRKTEYPALYAVIRDTYGATADTFFVPDYRGHFLRGSGAHGTAAKAAGGNFAGPAVGSREDDAMQGHYHGDVVGDTTGTATGGNNWTQGPTSINPQTINGSYVSSPITDGTNGEPRTGDETKPASYGVNYIIKT
jgi:microcystin-dependent protein